MRASTAHIAGFQSAVLAQSSPPGDRVIDQKHDDGADDRHEGGIEEAAFGGVTQRLKQRAADKCADESEGDVDQTAFAPAVDDAAGDEAAQKSDDDPPDDMHEKSAPLFEPKMVTPLLESKGQRENQAIATVAPAMTAVESQPRPARPILAVNWPISFRLPTTTIIATINGTAMTPLTTALQNSAFIGSNPE